MAKKAENPAKTAKRQAGGKFAKGVSGNPAGSKKGYKKAKTLMIEQKLEEFGCDPVKVLATICNDESEETSLRLHAAKELASYLFPKRKSVEHSGGLNNRTAGELSRNELMAIASGGEKGQQISWRSESRNLNKP